AKGDVRQTLQRSGLIEPVAQAAVAFPIAGNVASVVVQPGDSVTTGQTLATIDTSALQADLTAKESALAAAQLTLSKALDASNAAAAGTASTAAAADNSTQQARQRVTASQHQLDALMTDAATALNEAAAACTPTTSTTAPGDSTATNSSADCVAALQTSLKA